MKKINEDVGLIGSLLGHAAHSGFQHGKKALKAAGVALATPKVVLNRWIAKINKDWIQYSTIHGIKIADEKSLTEFVKDTYHMEPNPKLFGNTSSAQTMDGRDNSKNTNTNDNSPHPPNDNDPNSRNQPANQNTKARRPAPSPAPSSSNDNYSRQDSANDNSSPFHEGFEKLTFDDAVKLFEADAMSRVAIKDFFTNMARFFLKDQRVLQATQHYMPGSDQFNEYLAHLMKGNAKHDLLGHHLDYSRDGQSDREEQSHDSSPYRESPRNRQATNSTWQTITKALKREGVDIENFKKNYIEPAQNARGDFQKIANVIRRNNNPKLDKQILAALLIAYGKTYPNN